MKHPLYYGTPVANPPNMEDAVFPAGGDLLALTTSLESAEALAALINALHDADRCGDLDPLPKVKEAFFRFTGTQPTNHD